MIPGSRASSNIDYEKFIEYEFDGEVFNICKEQGLCHSSTCQSRSFLIRGRTIDGGRCTEAAYCLSASECPNSDYSYKQVLNNLFANEPCNKLTYEACFNENSKRLLNRIQQVNLNYKEDEQL